MTVHTAPPHTDTDTRAILQIVQEMLTAQEAEDVEAWLEFVDEDAVWLPPNEAPITGKAAIRDWVIGFYDLYSVAEEMTSAEVHVTGGRDDECGSPRHGRLGVHHGQLGLDHHPQGRWGGTHRHREVDLDPQSPGGRILEDHSRYLEWRRSSPQLLTTEVLLMKRLSLLLPFSLVVFACAPVEETPPAAEAGPTLAEIEAEVRARSEAVVAAEMSGDDEAAVSFFAPDAIVQMANAPQIQGHETLLQLYREVLGATLEFEGTATRVVPAASGDMAYEYGINRFVFDTPDGPMEDMGKYLVVWEKTDGEWYVAAIAVSSDAPPNG
jgi:ketosteroid isomerase-like protein